MSPSSTIDLDRSIPVMVRREEPPPSGPPPQLAKTFILIAAVAAGIGGLLLIALHPDKRLAAPVSLGYLMVSVAGALCWRSRTAWQVPAITGLFVAAILVMGMGAWRLRWGLTAPSLPMVPLLVCALTTVGGWRAGAVLATVAALMLWLVSGVMPPHVTTPGPGGGLLLVVHLLGIAVALAAGVGLGRVVSQAVQTAHKREQRFRSLLSLAADVYWEMDGNYQLVAAGQHDHGLRSLQAHTGLGALPWELPRFVCDPETQDLLMADLETRAPFRDLPFGWRNRDGSLRSYLASGEPRFDARGVFKGYWGVARDVTAVQAARAALQATEMRYQDLFARIPSPLVVHRQGSVVDANAAAVALFGHKDLASMLGTDLLASYEPADSRSRAQRRAEQLHGMPEGATLPVANFHLQVQGKLLAVQATGVRVQAQGGSAVLSIYVDVTERLAAEEAVRRSEAMLAHLVATSPDLITLTDVGTGRYAMVNQAFERLLGYSAREAMGRTSLELGVWGAGAVRQAFVDQLRDTGTVTDMPVTFVTKAGAPVQLRVSAARFAMDRRDYMVINARDVSAAERDRMERAAILDNASIGIAVTRDRRFVLANAHFEQIYGWGPGEIIGQSGEAVWTSDEDYAELGRQVGPPLARGEAIEVERLARRKDGSHFLVRARGRAIDPTRPADSGTVWIVEDVTERRQFELALARARDDAEAANRAKSAFLANTSHELRTPLNGMLGLARLASAEDVPEALRRQYLDQIADSAQALAAIITDILDLSKIEAGKLQLETTSFDLAELLRSLEFVYQTLAAARGLALTFEIDDSLRTPVCGDPLRVRQIVTNYLSNALKFTEQGSVRVRADRLPGGAVRVEVIDTGPGIAAAALGQLFKPFSQADQSTTRRYGGTGLGLSICRELALLMGGDVGVDSQPGQGSCFWALLPLPASGVEVSPPQPASEGDLAGMRVLMAEDNAVNMLIAVAMLERWGVEVAQAQDGAQAVKAVQQAAGDGRPFDLVLMDVQMPVMSGHEATRALRLLPEGRDLPIVALTAAALVTERAEALNAGMNDFLTKPVDADKLHAALLKCSARRGAGGAAPA
jgi:PAS domain S-box-containing protein